MTPSTNQVHPKLFLNSEKISQLRRDIAANPFLIKILENLHMQASRIENSSPVAFKITGPRMLSNCQEIFRRVRLLSFLYLIEGDEKFALRAKDELINAANYPHWNKDHFLDTAELITAFAIAYDWLHSALSKEDIQAIKDAMITKGILVGLEELHKNIWWAEHKYNWNQVCNGGLLIGALALCDEEPQLYEDVLAATRNRLPIAFKSFGKNGGWEAGPEYWQYTVWYSALLIDALNSVKGDDFGLSKTEGFNETGLFPVYSAGPRNKYFNFADADEDYNALPALFWLGERFNLEACIDENHRLLQIDIDEKHSIDPFNLLWYKAKTNTDELPLNRLFSTINAGYFRSAWNNKMATFIGFKGGYNQADHAHLDLGSFVLDMKGVRWVKDLGRDNYDLPGYFNPSEGGGRWKYFRLNNTSHNTLVLNNDYQRASARARIVEFNSAKNEAQATIDLKEAYQPHVKLVSRSIQLNIDESIIINDKIRWNKAGNNVARWQITTDAAIKLFGNKAELYKENQSIVATIINPENAEFRIVSAAQESPEKHNEGFEQLYLEIETDTDITDIKIHFSEV